MELNIQLTLIED